MVRCNLGKQAISCKFGGLRFPCPPNSNNSSTVTNHFCPPIQSDRKYILLAASESSVAFIFFCVTVKIIMPCTTISLCVSNIFVPFCCILRMTYFLDIMKLNTVVQLLDNLAWVAVFFLSLGGFMQNHNASTPLRWLGVCPFLLPHVWRRHGRTQGVSTEGIRLLTKQHTSLVNVWEQGKYLEPRGTGCATLQP